MLLIKGIILPVPTPFYHIWLAQDLLDHPGLTQQQRQVLESHWGSFLFGNTAPDVQAVSGQYRTETHFFDIPVADGAPVPWEVMFDVFPDLAAGLHGDHAAFIAGYVCHLLADWHWQSEIFAPNFGPACLWKNFRHRLYLHNVLRAYLDHQVVSQIDAGTAGALKQVNPDRWLPFAEDSSLREWRDFLYPQLFPGVTISTVEVFAARQHVEPAEYYRLLASEARMDEEVFSHLPRHQLSGYRQSILDKSVSLIKDLELV